MTDSAAPDPDSGVPVSLFSAVMGIAGLGLAWRKSAPVLGVPYWIGELLIFAGVLVFAWAAAAYGLKLARSPEAMRAETGDIRRLSFFAAIPLSLLLLASGALPLDRVIATLIWAAGISMQFILLLIFLSRWARGGHARRSLLPSAFLPTAGILLGPATGMALGFVELSWMLFSIGLLLWIIFLVLLHERLFFEMPVRDDELPLLAIAATPPSLAFISYTALNHQMIDGFARVLFYAAVFFLILTLAPSGRFIRLRFSVAWWSFTFPAAAAASAMMEYRMAIGTDFPAGFCVAALVLASGLVIYCGIRTVMGLWAGDLFQSPGVTCDQIEPSGSI